MNINSTRTALVVEDDFASRQYLTFLLKRMNIDSLVAENGEAALKMMKDASVDVMLLDIALGPGISGIQLCEQLNQEPRFSNTPAIAATAFAKENLEEFDRVGFVGYLPKPYTFDQLQAILKMYLD